MRIAKLFALVVGLSFVGSFLTACQGGCCQQQCNPCQNQCNTCENKCNTCQPSCAPSCGSPCAPPPVAQPMPAQPR